jgi:hypothetical protein
VEQTLEAGDYYAGHHTAQGTLVAVTRSGRTKPLVPVTILGTTHRPSSPGATTVGGQLALAILTDYLGGNLEEELHPETLYEPFKFSDCSSSDC